MFLSYIFHLIDIRGTTFAPHSSLKFTEPGRLLDDSEFSLKPS